MRHPTNRRNGRSLEVDAGLDRPSRWRNSKWLGTLRTTYRQASDGFTQWITRCIRNWESRTSIRTRRHHVLFLFGGLGSGWILRLVMLFQLPPSSTSLPLNLGSLGISSASTSAARGPAADSTHKANYLEARRQRQSTLPNAH